MLETANGGLSGFHGFGSMTKSQIRDKHPKGTKKGHIDRMHHHMQKGIEFGPAHDLATKEGFPAMGSIGFHNGVGEADSRQLPPGLRRRLMARTLETEVSGSHLGKQPVANDTQTNNVGQMFGLAGLVPETGSGWTE